MSLSAPHYMDASGERVDLLLKLLVQLQRVLGSSPARTTLSGRTLPITRCLAIFGVAWRRRPLRFERYGCAVCTSDLLGLSSHGDIGHHAAEAENYRAYGYGFMVFVL